MMKTLRSLMVVVLILSGVTVQAQLKSLLPKRNKYVYETVDAEQMIRRFVSKPTTAGISIEGIYSVSSVVTKKGKTLLSSEVKERVVDRKDNYANVAIIRDWSGSDNDFIQISLSQPGLAKFAIVAKLTTLSEGRGFLCRHTEPDGEVMTFTFTYGGDSDILEGTYTKVDGSKTITYGITLLKTFPKRSELSQ